MEAKATTIEEFRVHDADTGSADVQVALLTQRINHLTEHLKQNKKDHASRRGLLMMVGRRRRLLDYVHRHDADRYRSLTQRLKLRHSHCFEGRPLRSFFFGILGNTTPAEEIPRWWVGDRGPIRSCPCKPPRRTSRSLVLSISFSLPIGWDLE